MLLSLEPNVHLIEILAHGEIHRLAILNGEWLLWHVDQLICWIKHTELPLVMLILIYSTPEQGQKYVIFKLIYALDITQIYEFCCIFPFNL